jgi:hypothetical protein
MHKNYEYAYTNLFGEIKPKKGIKHKSELCKDLYRLGLFAHGMIKKKNLKAAMVCQAVDLQISFYMLEVTRNDFFTLTHITTIELPATIASLNSIVSQFDKMVMVARLYKKFCCNSGCCHLKISDAISYEKVVANVTDTQDCKRRCVVKYGH